jgi:hypothetical protein
MSIVLCDTACQYLNQSLNNISIGKGFNVALVNNLSTKFLLGPSYLIPTTAVINGRVDPAQVEKLKNTLLSIVEKVKARRALAKAPAGTTP